MLRCVPDYVATNCPPFSALTPHVPAIDRGRMTNSRVRDIIADVLLGDRDYTARKSDVNIGLGYILVFLQRATGVADN
jgi:hypothetical protein